MRIKHFSDIHSDLTILDRIPLSEDFGAWINTGDLFPNRSRGNRQIEPVFQEDWFLRKKSAIFKRLGGKPIVTVDGNHDFISFGEMLIKHGYQGEVYCIKPDEVIEFGGLSWAGYSHIPFIEGEWNNEAGPLELSQLAEKVCLSWADVLVTHVPPSNILSGPWGCSCLASYLAYHPHNFRYHFFGHVHSHHGQAEALGVKFFNSATTIQLVELA